MFESRHVVRVFEAATGILLERADTSSLDSFLASHAVGRDLSRVTLYESPKQAEGRLGGHFVVRVWETGDRDDGVSEEALSRWLPERGPREYYVGASARRANVEVMFWSDADEITPEIEAAWSRLTSFLYSL